MTLLTPEQKAFVDRMAFHMNKGQSFNEAAASVIDDDQRLFQAVRKDMTKPIHQRSLALLVCQGVFNKINNQHHQLEKPAYWAQLDRNIEIAEKIQLGESFITSISVS